MTPATPMSDPSTGKPRKVNPLVDLVETEKAYVERLTGIIRVRRMHGSRLSRPHAGTESRVRLVAIEPSPSRAGQNV
jgi:hypothetical protein